MKTIIALLLVVLFCIPARAVTCVGNMADIFGTTAGTSVRFIPVSPAGGNPSFVAVGNQTVGNWARSVPITNGVFVASNLVGGWYDSEFQPGGATIRILAQVGDTNTYTFNQLAQFAVNAYMFATNTLFQYAGTGYVSQVAAPLANTNWVAALVQSSGAAGSNNVNQAIAALGTAASNYVNQTAAPLASTGYVASALAPYASIAYVGSAISPLASAAWVASQVAPLASTGYVAAAISPLASRAYVDNAATPAVTNYVNQKTAPLANTTNANSFSGSNTFSGGFYASTARFGGVSSNAVIVSDASSNAISVVPDTTMSISNGVMSSLNGGLGQSVNLHLLNKFLQNIATLNSGVTNATVLVFGDSTSDAMRAPQQVLIESVGQRWGRGVSSEGDTLNVYAPGYAVSAGATHTALPDTNWWTSYFFIPASESVMITNAVAVAANASTPDGWIYDARGVEVLWEGWTNGGTFKIQVDKNDGGGFTDLATVSGAAYSNTVFFTNIVWSGFPSLQCHFRMLGLTGTNMFLGCAPVFGVNASSSVPGALRTWRAGQSGVGMDAYVGVQSNVLFTGFQQIHPQLWAFSMKHSVTINYTNLTYLQSILTNASPGCVMLLFGTPNDVLEGAALDAALNKNLHDFAYTNGQIYVDTAFVCPDTNWMQLNGWYTANDGLHTTTDGWRILLRPWMHYWGLDINPNSQQYFSSIVIGTPNFNSMPGATFDPNAPLQLGTRSSPGGLSWWFSPGNFQAQLRYGSLSSPQISDVYSVFGGALEHDFYSGSRLRFTQGSSWPNQYEGTLTSGKGWYFGSDFTVDNVPQGCLTVQSNLTAQTESVTGSFTAGSASITGTLTAGGIGPSLVTNRLAVFTGQQWSIDTSLSTRLSPNTFSASPVFAIDGMSSAGNTGQQIAVSIPEWVTSVSGTLYVQCQGTQAWTNTLRTIYYSSAGRVIGSGVVVPTYGTNGINQINFSGVTATATNVPKVFNLFVTTPSTNAAIMYWLGPMTLQFN